MSNTIKLKRGSGSDPSASDLEVGELAIRTDSGKIFTKKDNGSVAEISGGGGIDDGDKGDITVSNGGDTFTIDNNAITTAKIADVQVTTSKLVLNAVTENRITDGAVTSAKIANDTIVNADINSSAAIAGSKISPTFTSDLTVEHSGHPAILIHDTSGDNQCKLKFQTDSKSWSCGLHGGEDRWKVSKSDTFGTNDYLEVDNGGSLHISNNIVVGGTVDGVDIAARNTLFGGLTSSSGVLTNGVTATTQSAGNNTTRVATTAFVSTAIANLVDSAPGTLNTLNELAAALGDDANFSTTVTNSIATKMPLAGGEFTGNITTHDVIPDSNAFRNIGTSSVKFNQVHATTFHGSGANLTNLPSQTDQNFTNADHSKLDGIEANATADQTASEILTLIKTVDGAGSGLDADTLDGISSASFLRSDTADTMTGNFSLHGNLLLTGDATTTNQNRTISFTGFDKEGTSDTTDNAFIRHTTNTGGLAGSVLEIGSLNDSNDGIAFNTNNHNNNLRLNGNKIWNAGNDGSGSGLDSDLLDGQEGSYYRTATNLNSGTLLAARLGVASTSEAGVSAVGNFGQYQTHGTYTNFNTEPAYWGWNYVQGNTNAPNTTSSQWYRCRLSLGSEYGKGSDSGDYSLEMALPRSSHSAAGVLHIRTIEGGNEGSWTTVGDNASLITTGTLPAARLPNHSASLLTSGTIPSARLSASDLLTLIKTVDGAGSGLDADTLDGISSASFLRSDAADVMSQGTQGTATLDVRNTGGSGSGTGTGAIIATFKGDSDAIDIRNINGGDYGIYNNQQNNGIELFDGTGGVRIIYNGNIGVEFDSGNAYGDFKGVPTVNGTSLVRTSDTIASATNADTVDSLHASSFLRSDANDTSSGVLTLNRASSDGINLKIYNTTNGSSATIEFSDQSTQTQKGRLEYRHTDTASNSAGNSFHFDSTETSTAVIIDQTAGNSGFYVGTNEVWHAGNDGSGSGLDADTLDGVQGSSYLRSDSSDTMSANLTITGRLDVGDGSGNDTEIRVFKADNNVSDHIQFYNGTTRVGEIGCKDTTWLRINQDTAKNIYTPRYIRADAGFFVDGTSKGINGSGNFIGGTIAGASDYGTLVRSNASDTLTGGTYTFNSSTDQKIILQGSTNPYIRFKQGTTEKAFIQWNDSTNSIRLRNQEDNAELRIKDDLQFSTDASTFYSIWHAGNDGSGSGLDSDTVDGIQGASLLRSDADDNVTGHTEWQDNYQVRLGNGADMRLYHNATDSYIDNHVGHIYIRNAGSNDNKNIYIQARDGEHSIICEDDADVRLFSDNTEVFRTDTTSSCKVKHLYPWSDSAYDLGTSSNRFRNIYGDTLYGDGSNLTGISAGATGGGSDEVFYENDQTVTTNYTITNGKNAMAAGPITINSGVTVTVGSGENLTIV